MNALVDGNLLNTRVSTYQGVYNVHISYGSFGGALLLKGNGWHDLILKSFGNRLTVLHLMKCEEESLYVTGYDTGGIKITGEVNEGSPSKRCMIVMSDLPGKKQSVNHEYMRHYLLDGQENMTKLRSEDMEWHVNMSFAVDPNTGALIGAAFTV